MWFVSPGFARLVYLKQIVLKAGWTFLVSDCIPIKRRNLDMWLRNTTFTETTYRISCYSCVTAIFNIFLSQHFIICLLLGKECLLSEIFTSLKMLNSIRFGKKNWNFPHFCTVPNLFYLSYCTSKLKLCVSFIGSELSFGTYQKLFYYLEETYHLVYCLTVFKKKVVTGSWLAVVIYL